jgi:hypothetical protein
MTDSPMAKPDPGGPALPLQLERGGVDRQVVDVDAGEPPAVDPAPPLPSWRCDEKIHSGNTSEWWDGVYVGGDNTLPSSPPMVPSRPTVEGITPGARPDRVSHHNDVLTGSEPSVSEATIWQTVRQNRTHDRTRDGVGGRALNPGVEVLLRDAPCRSRPSRAVGSHRRAAVQACRPMSCRLNRKCRPEFSTT